MERRFHAIDSAEDASMLNGLAFEEYLGQLFDLLGYKADVTRASGDYGGDVLLEKGDDLIVVQAKQYSHPVGFEAVKEAHFAKDYYSAKEAWVVTTSTFTQQAQAGAERVGVRLVDGEALSALIREAKGKGCEERRTTQSPKPVGGRYRGDRQELLFAHVPGRRGGEKVLKQYRGSGPTVTVPDGVTALGAAAFVGGSETFVSGYRRVPLPCRYGLEGPYCASETIVAVRLPDGLLSVGPSCFEGCTRLETVTLPPTVEKIKESAFASCGFGSVRVLAGVDYGPFVYDTNRRLLSVTCEDDVTSISKGCFAHCDRLTDVSLSQKVKSIAERAFEMCASLEEITIPEGVENIGRRAFYGCESLDRIYLPRSLRSIASDAFDQCPALRGLSIWEAFDLSGVRIIGPEDPRNPWVKGKGAGANGARAAHDELDVWVAEYRRAGRAEAPLEDALIDAAHYQAGDHPVLHAKRARETLERLGLRDDLVKVFLSRPNLYSKMAATEHRSKRKRGLFG